MANLSTSDTRMLELIGILKEAGEIRFTTEFCEIAGVQKQNIRRIKTGAASFTGAHIERICRHFNVNANWIMGLETKIFRTRVRNASAAEKLP